MAVAPDLLLSSAAEVRPRAPSKAAAAPSESNAGQSSSFARVLADERRADTASARQAESRANADKAQAEQQSQNSGAIESHGEPAVAEDGNSLPVADEAEPVLDPLLLLGLGGESGAEVEIEGTAPSGTEVEVPIPVAIGLPVSAAPVIEPEVEQLNSAASVQVVLDTALKADLGKFAKSVLSPGSAPAGGSEAAVKALGGLSVEPDATLDLDAFVLEVAEQLPDSLKDAGNDSPLDNQALRLNVLAQAVSQAGSAQRPLVPGQPVAMQQGGWSEAVVDRVMWLSSQNLRSAEIQLDPAELGRLDVRVSLNQDQALVSFSSPHAGVREALESQMYRMRELFAQQGMNQVDVSVSDQSLARNFEGRRDDEQASTGAGGTKTSNEGDERVVDETRLPQAASIRGLVDYYA